MQITGDEESESWILADDTVQPYSGSMLSGCMDFTEKPAQTEAVSGDLVERLRDSAKEERECASMQDFYHEGLLDEAADRIEALEKQLRETREALLPFARIADMEERARAWDSVIVNVSRCRDARAFLNGEQS